MGSREFLRQASTQAVEALDTGKPVKDIGDRIYEEHRSRYPDHTPDIDAHYYSIRRTRQVFNAAVCEIAWRGALASMDAHRQSTGSLVPEIGLSFVEHDPQNSPTLRRFLATMQHWFGGALQRTLDDLRQKSGKDGPYDDIHTVYSEYIQAYENWRWNSSHPRALVARGWNDYPMAPEESIHRIVRENCAIIAWKVVGVGLVSENPLSLDLDEQVLKRIEKVSDMTSLKKPANIPYFKLGEALCAGYSAWEQGQITSEELRSLENPNSSEDSLHPALCSGPLPNTTSACAGDGDIACPDRFLVTPDIFVKRLGAKRRLGRTTIASLALVSGYVIGRETLFTNWPK